MLGHADLSTTEIYTQVSIKAVKAVHTATHPANPIVRASARHVAGDGDAPAVGVLLAALDREAEAEDA